MEADVRGIWPGLDYFPLKGTGSQRQVPMLFGGRVFPNPSRRSEAAGRLSFLAQSYWSGCQGSILSPQDILVGSYKPPSPINGMWRRYLAGANCAAYRFLAFLLTDPHDVGFVYFFWGEKAV